MMTVFWCVFCVASVWLTVLAWFDCRIRRLPNWLTLPPVALFPCFYFLMYGWSAAKSSLLGGLIGGCFLLLPYFLRGAGAGDVKMFAAVGCMTGFPQILYALVITAVAGLVLGLGMMLYAKWDTKIFRHWLHVCFDIGYDRKAGAEKLAAVRSRKVFIPYGVAIAQGGWGSFIWMYLLMRSPS